MRTKNGSKLVSLFYMVKFILIKCNSLKYNLKVYFDKVKKPYIYVRLDFYVENVEFKPTNSCQTMQG